MRDLFAVVCLALTLANAPTHAQPFAGDDPSVWKDDIRVQYGIDLTRAPSQLIDVRIAISGVDTGTVEFHMPTWRPGRYVILDPAGTVRDVRATDGAQTALPVRKTAKSTWVVETKGQSSVQLAYTLYANSISDRTRHADDSHAFISPSSVLMYTDEHRDEPCRVLVHTPQGADWRVATGLDAESTTSFVARDYDTLVDCPLEIGEHQLISFNVDGVPHEIVIWGEAEPDADRLREDVSAIVREQARVFGGELPYGRYVYLVHSAPGIGGGTEHLNSTIMQTRPSTWTDDGAYERFLGLVSHEMFHTWNVKRLRPAGLVPYDYQRENYTDLLWVAEGTTSYYDDLTLVRTGLISVDDYLGMIRGTIGGVLGRPGVQVQSLADSSFDAWIKFNRSTPDDVNSTVSFYSQGALVSLLLDLEVRRTTEGRVTLDDVLRALYARHPLEAGGFTTDDMLSTLAVLTGTAWDEFFERWVRSARAPDVTDALAWVGVEVTPNEPEDGAYIGLDFRDEDGFAAVRAVRTDGPAFGTGILAGDLVVAIDGARATPSSITEHLEDAAPGAAIELTLFRRDHMRRVTLVASTPPVRSWKVKRMKEPTPQQRQRFEAWVGQPWDDDAVDGAASQEDAPHHP